jgi:hypothetical protein
MWPLQEFRYSRSISIIYASPEVANYYSQESGGLDPEQLVGYSRQKCQRIAAQDSAQYVDTARILLNNFLFYNDIYTHITAKLLFTGGKIDSGELAARFLLGARLVIRDKKSNDRVSQNKGLEDRMLSFAKVLAALKLLGGIKSRVSKDRDYILSVWVDLDTYKISLHFQALSVEELLEDALLQLHREYRVFVSSRYPAGLMESDLRTACWFVNCSGNEQKSRTAQISLLNSIGMIGFSTQTYRGCLPLREDLKVAEIGAVMILGDEEHNAFII